jgi:hypothetical protein
LGRSDVLGVSACWAGWESSGCGVDGIGEDEAGLGGALGSPFAVG